MNDVPQHVLTIAELNQRVKTQLERDIGMVWLQGECSNLAKPSSGHLYFSLKDQHAQIQCAWFKRQQPIPCPPLAHGDQLLVAGCVSLYPQRGDYQLIVEQVQYIGAGQLELAYHQLKKKLHSAGLFEKKQPLPRFPQNIGLITSSTGAALQDLLRVLHRRWPIANYHLFPTAVQGAQAAPSIIHAMKDASQSDCDVLILARGGGSLEDLWGFNHEELAQIMYACPLPIVTGIGHEIDYTIADFVADHRAATPSAAAETATPDQQHVQTHLKEMTTRLTQRMQNCLQTKQQTLHVIGQKLTHPQARIQIQQQHLDHQRDALEARFMHQLQHYQHQFYQRVQALEAHNPLATLERGFVMVECPNTQQAITRCQHLNKSTVQLRFHDGKALADITAIHPDAQTAES